MILNCVLQYRYRFEWWSEIHVSGVTANKGSVSKNLFISANSIIGVQKMYIVQYDYFSFLGHYLFLTYLPKKLFSHV